MLSPLTAKWNSLAVRPVWRPAVWESVWVIRKLLPLQSARGMLTFSCNASILEGGEKRIRSSHHPWLNIEFKASPGYNETLLKNQTKPNKPQLLTMSHELKDHLDRSVPSFPVAFFSTLPSSK